MSHAISKTLGTQASVESVQLSFPNRIIIDGVTILDQQQKEAIHIGRLSTKLQWLPLAEGRIVISSAQLFGAHVNIEKPDEQSPANIQFILDALASNDTTSQAPVNLRINSLIVRHSSMSYHQLDVPETKQLNTRHLTVDNISSHIILKVLTEDSLSVKVKRLTFNERSGLSINHLAFFLNAGKNGALLSDFALHLPHSMLTVDSIQATYQDKHIKETLRYRLNRLQADMKLSDLKRLVTELENYPDIVSLSTTLEGTAQSINMPRLRISSTGRELTLYANGWVTGLDQPSPRWHAEIHRFSAADNLIRNIANDFEAIPEPIANIGKLQLSGSFEGKDNGSIESKALIEMGIGSLNMDFDMAADKTFTGYLNTKGIDLKQLLADDQLGLLATTVEVKGTPSAIAVYGDVEQFDYNGYSYKNIHLNGKYSPEDIQGSFEIEDPHLRTNVKGEWRKEKKQMALRIVGDIENIEPQALHLSDKWGDAAFSASLDADIHASNLNDAEGSIALKDFVMNDSTGFFRIDKMLLKTGFAGDNHFLKFSGDIGEGVLIGQFDWNTLPNSVVSCISSHLSTMPGLPKVSEKTNNNFNIDIYVMSSEWLKRILGVPITLDAPIRLKGNLNDLTHTINLDGNLPGFYYNEGYYRNANLHLTTIGDSIVCKGNIAKYMDDDTKMDLLLQASASNSLISTNFNFNNHTEGMKAMKGELNMRANLYTNKQGKPEVHVSPQSSHLTLGDTQWNILPNHITYTDNCLRVDHFTIEHNDQHLIIDGIASKDSKDTLFVDMKGIDVSYVLDLLNFHPVEFAGYVTGRAYASQLFEKLDAKADIEVSRFMFEGGRMGTLHAKAQWNTDKEQIDIDAIADDGPDAKTIIKGFVSPVHENIGLNIQGQGTHIDFVHTYTNSFLKDISGQAYGDIQLVGPLGAMDLLGTLVVDGQASVTPLGTTYTLKGDTVRFIHNDILLNRASIYDANGDVAYLSGGIHHENLSDMTFDLDVETDKFLAYDFKELGTDLFCGTVEARGRVDLHGRPGEVVINCEGTPLKSTVFTYNAALTDAVSDQNFITWRSKRSPVYEHKNNVTKNEPESIPTDIYINFLINANPDATVKLLMDAKTNDYITLYGSGVLRASYHNKGAFQMFGTYTVDYGTYGITIQNIIKKNFVFNEGGKLVFSGNPMDASLQLQAVYTVNGVSLSDLNIGNSFTNNTVKVNCLMNITGQAGAPRVDFDLDMPNVNSEEKQMVRSVITSEQEMNQQVLYLLGIGRFYTQGVNNAETQEYGQTQLAMQSFLSGTLSTQINEVISQVIKNDDWNFGANISTGNEGWHNAEYEGLISGRMLNNRLLINGQFGYRDNAKQETPSFIGDFDIRYLLQPNGNLALKMYNQTNDRYFTRSSLNTQGIGIIIKKDFDGIGDLFMRKKKKNPSTAK